MAQASASWDEPVPAAAEVFGDDGHTVVVLHGEFDLDTVDVLTDALARAHAAYRDDVVIDLQDVGFMSAATVEAIGRARDLLARRSRSLVVRHPSLAAALTLGLAGYQDLVEPHSTSEGPATPSAPCGRAPTHPG